MKRAIAKLWGVVAVAAIAAGAQTQPATRPVRLNWTASSSSGVTSYNVYRCAVTPPATMCIPTAPAIASTAGATVAVDVAPAPATYVYGVTAVSAAGESALATIVAPIVVTPKASNVSNTP
jgi:hypothetical protein